MDLQLWTISRLGRLPVSLRQDVRFYAPLIDSLDFMGIEPATFLRAGGNVRVGRDGLVHSLGANVPRFDYSGEVAQGLLLSTAGSESLQYSVQNALDNANTLIWFQEGAARSTPTNANPFTSTGLWGGTLDVHIKHIVKFSRVLTNAEITQVQAALSEVVQVIPPPPSPPVISPGVFVNEVPAGSGVTYTLSNDPNVASLIVNAHGVVLKRVVSAPGNLEFTVGGTGNRTLTFGMAPSGTSPTQCFYVIA